MKFGDKSHTAWMEQHSQPEVRRPHDNSYTNGRSIYHQGLPLTECRNDRERIGWWHALHAQSNAETSAYLEAEYHNQPGVAEAQPCIQ